MTTSEITADGTTQQSEQQHLPAQDVAGASSWFKGVIARLEHKAQVAAEQAAGSSSANQQQQQQLSSEQQQEYGIQPSLKSVYEGKPDCQCCINWVNEPPAKAKEEEAEQQESKKHALLVRHKKGHDVDRPPHVLHSIKVQSPLLRALLGDVLKGYPGITPELENLTFEAPFEPLFHRLPELRSATRGEIDPATVEHLDLLFETISKDMWSAIRVHEDCVSKGVITYEHLWALFRPGDLMVSRHENGEDQVSMLRGRAFTVLNNDGRDVGYSVPCYCIDWDGEMFGWRLSNIQIPPFGGTQAITSLDVFPLSFHADAGELRERLAERGRRFEGLSGIHYVGYAGSATWSDEYRQLMKLTPKAQVSGRIVVDAIGFSDFAYWDQLHLTPLPDIDGADYTPEELAHKMMLGVPKHPDLAGRAKHGHVPLPIHPPPQGFPPRQPPPPCLLLPPVARPGPRENTKKTPQRPLVPEEHLLCTSVVRGYSMTLKKWAQFNVNGIRSIPFGTQAFNKLVLPASIKETIVTLVEGQLDETSDFDDFMLGKGRGVVFLLAGSPGVGKTLTAESVAEHLQVPLYSLGATDLGEDAEDSQDAIEKVFPMMVRWKGVLLLDEADVFLARRSLDTPETNRVVSEYYRGILFLTTNRVECIDPAMKSRIHITLTYKDLNSATRKSIWKNFISSYSSSSPSSSQQHHHRRRQQENINLTDRDVALLSEVEMNGRQIKNVFKIAGLLAGKNKVPLSVKHIKAAMEVAATETTEIGLALA
ncbi:P-loop containing nucleoside triphosphate hydrolase protein [Zalerion maritima]|uniref:P-loop containing nucleoside triphosphate hydrolase protein n=1 Tax=Zalerion maritima TaxID=339359 RepID=A0AAD5RUY5_9PEZI|nr:P-loop containing nucleoside triphosphate hydrolase protein [Zalerion maritima]